jgi:hypothetical protein
MTLSVTPNKNGTITVECGGESVTIAAPNASGTSPQPQQGASGEPPVLWPNGGATASIIDNREVKTEIVPVPSVVDLPRIIQEKYDLHAKAKTPIVFQFHVKGDNPLSVERINKALSDLGNPEWMGTQFKLTGLRDE